MKPLRLLGLGLLLCSGLALAVPDRWVLSQDQVINVHDGDTLTVNLPDVPAVLGQHLGVRVRGIDTPELHSQCPTLAQQQTEEFLAQTAKAKTEQLVRQATVIELRDLGRDKYFRLLASVWLDGVDLSQQLIQLGLADPYNGGTKRGWCSRPKP